VNKQSAIAGLIVVVGVSLGLFVLLGGSDAPSDDAADDGARKRPQGASQRVDVEPEGGGPAPSTDPTPVETDPTPEAPDSTDPDSTPDPTPVAGTTGADYLLVGCTLDGEPLEGATVFGRYGDGSQSEFRTGADGSVQVPVPAGEQVSVAATHPLDLTLSWRPPQPGGGALSFAFSGKQTAFLEGRLLDDEGQALLEAELVLYDAQEGGHAVLDAQQIQLRPDGSFGFEVGEGNYALRGRTGPSESSPIYFSLAAGGRHDVGEVRIPRASRIAGTVTLPPNLTVTLPVRVNFMIEVRAPRRDDDENKRVWGRRIVRPLDLDADLAYALELPPGELRVRVEVPLPGDHQVGHWHSVNLEPGVEQTVDLELSPLSVSLRGVVRDDTGHPLAGAKVGYRGTNAVTDAQGNYALRGLDMGDLELVVTSPGHEQGFVRKTFTGAALVIDFDLQRLGSLSGVVRDGAGAPKSGVPISIDLRKDTGEVVPFSARSDGSGSYSLSELVPGRYVVSAGGARQDVVVRPAEQAQAPDLIVP